MKTCDLYYIIISSSFIFTSHVDIELLLYKFLKTFNYVQWFTKKKKKIQNLHDHNNWFS